MFLLVFLKWIIKKLGRTTRWFSPPSPPAPYLPTSPFQIRKVVSLIWVPRGTHHPLPRRHRHQRWSHHTHRGQDQQECLSQALFWPQETFCTLPWSKTPRPGTTSYQKWKEKKNKNLEKQALGAIKTSWEGLPPTYLPQGGVHPSFNIIHVLRTVRVLLCFGGHVS